MFNSGSMNGIQDTVWQLQSLKLQTLTSRFERNQHTKHKTVMSGGGMKYVLYAGRGGSGVGRI